VPRYARVDEPVRSPYFDEMSELELLLFRQDNVISRRQALRHLSLDAIRHRLESGRWRQAVRGVYVAHSGPVTAEQRWMIASLACGAGRRAPLAGVTALTIAGLRGYPAGVVHVLMPWHRRDRNAPYWVAVHRTRHLPASQVHRLATPPYTLPARSLVDAAQWARDDDAAAALVASAFQQRLVTADEVNSVLVDMPGIHRRRLIGAMVADVAGGSHSLPELEFVHGCRREGLPEPSRQVRRDDSTGRRRYLDALFEPYGVHVEIDGAQHLEVRRYWADMQRQNDLWIPGERVLRFPAYIIRMRPDLWVPQLRKALIEAGWNPIVDRTMAVRPSSGPRSHRSY
jgi:hypothetical protein